MTRFPNSVFGAWWLATHSSWYLLFAPSPPPLSLQRCSATSSLIQEILTAPNRASSATTLHLPAADHQRPDGQLGALPVPEQGTYTHASPYDHAEPNAHSRFPHTSILPSGLTNGVGALNCLNFRGSISRPVYAPTDASPPASRPTTHGLGSIWFATPFIVRDFHSVFLAGLTGALATSKCTSPSVVKFVVV